jgi:SHS2 domain-containing protein
MNTEYLDRAAGVRLHAWGETLEEAFEQRAVAMCGYMTDIDTVELSECRDEEAEGHDMLSLVSCFGRVPFPFLYRPIKAENVMFILDIYPD